MARLGDMLPTGIIEIGKSFVTEEQMKEQELGRIAEEIWNEIAVRHNRWSGIEQELRNGRHRGIQLSDEDIDKLKSMVKYHFEQTQQAMAGID